MRYQYNHHPLLPSRFWNLVDVYPGSCWLWKGTRDRQGYGQFWGYEADKKLSSSHRVSWELHNGPIPDDLWVLHKCDNPPCVNPDHLYLGTHRDNMLDRRIRGRSGVKLTLGDVEQIRLEIASGTVTQKDTAKKWGVTPLTIYHIKSGVTWKPITNGDGPEEA